MYQSMSVSALPLPIITVYWSVVSVVMYLSDSIVLCLRLLCFPATFLGHSCPIHPQSRYHFRKEPYSEHVYREHSMRTAVSSMSGAAAGASTLLGNNISNSLLYSYSTTNHNPTPNSSSSQQQPHSLQYHQPPLFSSLSNTNVNGASPSSASSSLSNGIGAALAPSNNGSIELAAAKACLLGINRE